MKRYGVFSYPPKTKFKIELQSDGRFRLTIANPEFDKPSSDSLELKVEHTDANGPTARRRGK